MQTQATTSLPLQDKIAFVTGGSRGIGAAIVRRLASQGANVVFTYQSSAAEAQALAATVETAGGKAHGVQAEAADAAALTAAIAKVAAQFGRIDILVNNAGVFLPGAIDDFSLADFDKTLNVNVRAVFVAIKVPWRTCQRAGASSTSAARMRTACRSAARPPTP